MNKNYINTVNYLKNKSKILFLTTSNRSNVSDDIPKSTQLAYLMQEDLDKSKVTIIDVSKLEIYQCEGNVSLSDGDSCGVKDAILKNKNKNPSGYHRCWASLNNENDELWKITRELFESDVVIFFGSIRWGKLNAVYAKLIERLNWIENRHTTLKESNAVKDIDVGVIATGHNWDGKNAIEHEKQVLDFFGFNTPSDLFWVWQWTSDQNDESKSGYKKDPKDFQKEFEIDKKVFKFDRFK